MVLQRNGLVARPTNSQATPVNASESTVLARERQHAADQQIDGLQHQLVQLKQRLADVEALENDAKSESAMIHNLTESMEQMNSMTLQFAKPSPTRAQHPPGLEAPTRGQLFSRIEENSPSPTAADSAASKVTDGHTFEDMGANSEIEPNAEHSVPGVLNGLERTAVAALAVRVDISNTEVGGVGAVTLEAEPMAEPVVVTDTRTHADVDVDAIEQWVGQRLQTGGEFTGDHTGDFPSLCRAAVEITQRSPATNCSSRQRAVRHNGLKMSDQLVTGVVRGTRERPEDIATQKAGLAACSAIATLGTRWLAALTAERAPEAAVAAMMLHVENSDIQALGCTVIERLASDDAGGPVAGRYRAVLRAMALHQESSAVQINGCQVLAGSLLCAPG